jgi:8-oxo-dGTP pyrophosphatase MutT (NUDIX family)
MRSGKMQYAALPYRLGDELELLLITSRDTGRWVLPKGWPMKGKKGHAAAAQEALEEAGLKGKIHTRAIGHYSYPKRQADGSVIVCTVKVFPLAVERQLAHWPEQEQRSFQWFTPVQACSRVAEPELAELISGFAPKPRRKAS